ncbi:DHH family phosphoesterase [Paenibacillus pinihumi]|uniref:DHH family phosphoesterase n=1 Tax=Paenibacillus pinihumi TaxID=669462 RepID=UPI00042371A2|nr:hypothetical protein [Paenibacillus pinihumi]
MSRIKLFTHTDLDGVGCAVVAWHAFGTAVDIEYCDYPNVNEKVAAFLDDPGQLGLYDEVFITDISVNEEVAEHIDADNSLTARKWRLLDHHATAEWLNRYEWATVLVEVYEYHSDSTVKQSGAHMLYWRTEGDFISEIEPFIAAVRSYDTWDWTKTGDTAAKDLNDLFWLIGRDRFLERFVADLSVTLTESERMLLDIERERIDRYKESKLHQVTVKQIGGYTVGIVFADRYQSEVGSYIVMERADIDFVAMIDPARSVSYRSADGRTDVGLFAKSRGGGGHKHAAGSPVTDELRQAIIDTIFGGATN